MDKKIGYIDALRGLAILGVVIIHVGFAGSKLYFPQTFQNLISSGAMGVQLFFVVSAFTLFLSLDNRKGTEKTPLLNFFVRRFFRIAPVYYVGIVYFHFQSYPHPSTGQLLSNIFLLHGVSPYWIAGLVPGGWTIGTECLFYCLVPFLFSKVKNLHQAFYLVVITLIIRLFAYLVLTHFQLIPDHQAWVYYLAHYLPDQLPVFSLGILLFFILKEESLTKQSTLLMSALTCVLFLLVTNTLIVIFSGEFIFGVAFVLLTIVLSQSNSKIFVNPAFINLGKVSYSMYMVHNAILFWLAKYHYLNYIPVTNALTAVVNFCIRFLIVIALSYLISFCTYNMIERQFQKLGKRLNK